jgi:hypothetical protein
LAYKLQFPEPEKKRIVETPLMISVIERSMGVHPGGPVVVATGPSRNGKTTCFEWMQATINSAANSSPHGFRAVHLEVGGEGSSPSKLVGSMGLDAVAEGKGWRARNEMKRAIRSLYHAGIAKMDEGLYRQSPTEELARHLVEGYIAKRVQMVFVDEAGLLSVDGIRGLILVRDIAQLMHWPLSIVLIGMDDLPIKVRSVQQIKNRIHEWIYFAPYALDECMDFVVALEPQFAALNRTAPETMAMARYIHEQCGGLPGLVAPFLRRVRAAQRTMLSQFGSVEPLSLELMEAVQSSLLEEERRSVDASCQNYPDDTPDLEKLQTPKEELKLESDDEDDESEEAA